MTAPKEPEMLISLSQLCRQVDIPWSRAMKLIAEKKLAPDYSTERVHLFKVDRIPEVRALLNSELE
jgi:hypothetical protein